MMQEKAGYMAKAEPEITYDEIAALAIDLELAQARRAQCEKMLSAACDVADIMERKAITLFNLYFIAIAAIASLDKLAEVGLLYDLKYSVAAMVAGIFLAASALFPLKYGRIGAHPAAWMKPEVLQGDKARLAQSLVRYAWFYQHRIDVSEKSNALKLWLLYASIGSDIMAVLLALIARA